MKTVSIDEAKSGLKKLIEEAKKEAIVILQEGKPVGVLSAWPEIDSESLERAASIDFWNLIQARRKSPTVPWPQAKKEAGL